MPEDHCCINVALYGPKSRWTMTERPRGQMTRDAAHFRVGPSALRWEDGALTITIDETAVPHLGPVRGTVRLVPEALTAVEAQLDAGGRHHWRPYAPLSRIEARFERPGLAWHGHGYLDSNRGDRALEADFSYWNWSRSRTETGATIFYEADRRDGSHLSLALGFGPDGSCAEVARPPVVALPGTLWRVRRQTRSEAPATVMRKLEDAPFYARAMLETRLGGARAETVHETLDLDRYATRWVKSLIPWRNPRAIWQR